MVLLLASVWISSLFFFTESLRGRQQFSAIHLTFLLSAIYGKWYSGRKEEAYSSCMSGTLGCYMDNYTRPAVDGTSQMDPTDCKGAEVAI